MQAWLARTSETAARHDDSRQVSDSGRPRREEAIPSLRIGAALEQNITERSSARFALAVGARFALQQQGISKTPEGVASVAGRHLKVGVRRETPATGRAMAN